MECALRLPGDPSASARSGFGNGSHAATTQGAPQISSRYRANLSAITEICRRDICASKPAVAPYRAALRGSAHEILEKDNPI